MNNAHKRNLLVNYSSQIYTSLVGIVMMPVYVRYVGFEAFGLIGFYTMLQAWVGFLDVGFTPSITRETTSYINGKQSIQSYFYKLHIISLIFWSIGIFAVFAIINTRETIIVNWLKINSSELININLAFIYIAFVIGIRWVANLYKGVLNGAEKFTSLSFVTVFVSTFRYVFVLISMGIWGYTIDVFFAHQFVSALIELIALTFLTKKILPTKNTSIDSPKQNCGLRNFFKISSVLGITSIAWAIVMQIDKLFLSYILPLAEYGEYTLAVTVAGGILIVNAPLGTTIMPRLTSLFSSESKKAMIDVYSKYTQLATALIGSLVITMAFCAFDLMYAWTGEGVIGTDTIYIMIYYVIGNGLMVIGAFPYYYQFATGDMKYLLRGNLTVLALYVPIMWIATSYYGGIGAGITFMIMNVIYLFCWVNYIHSKLLPEYLYKWFFNDVLRTIFPGLLVCYYISQHFSFGDTRFDHATKVVFCELLTFIVMVFSTPFFACRIKSRNLIK